MSLPTTANEHPPRPTPLIEVIVTTSLSHASSYRHEYRPDTPVSTVRSAAMTHFGIEPDPNYGYYLVHNRQQVPDTADLGSLAGEHHEVEFRLSKEIKQG